MPGNKRRIWTNLSAIRAGRYKSGNHVRVQKNDIRVVQLLTGKADSEDTTFCWNRSIGKTTVSFLNLKYAIPEKKRTWHPLPKPLFGKYWINDTLPNWKQTVFPKTKSEFTDLHSRERTYGSTAVICAASSCLKINRLCIGFMIYLFADSNRNYIPYERIPNHAANRCL